MKTLKKFRSIFLALSLAFSPMATQAEDIDIFTGDSGKVDNPNILITVDNTANWSASFDGGTQGAKEAEAIEKLLYSPVVTDNVNIGLMEFATKSNKTAGGFIRFPVLPMTGTKSDGSAFIANTLGSADPQLDPAINPKMGNKGKLIKILRYMQENVTAPEEKNVAAVPYGNLMYDVYNYFTGGKSATPASVEALVAHPGGYAIPYTDFKSPLSELLGCASNYLIHIGNPPGTQQMVEDELANKNALIALGCNANNVGRPEVEIRSPPSSTVNLGYTACIAPPADATTDTTAINSAFPALCPGGGRLDTYASCQYQFPFVTTNQAICAAGTLRYGVTKAVNIPASTGGEKTSACSASPPASASTTDFPVCANVSCTIGGASGTSGSCPSGTSRYMVMDVTNPTSVGPTDGCFSTPPSPLSTSLAATCSGTGVSCSTPEGVAAAAACSSGNRYKIRDLVTTLGVTTPSNQVVCYKATPGNPRPSTAITETTTSTVGGVTTAYANYRWVDSGDRGSCAASENTWNAKADKTVTSDKGYSVNCAAAPGSASLEGYSFSGTVVVNGTDTSSAALSCPGSYKAYNFTKGSSLDKGYSTDCVASTNAANASTAGYTVTGEAKVDVSRTSSSSLACPGTSKAYSVSWPAVIGAAVDSGNTNSCYSTPAAATAAVDYGTACTASAGVTCAINSDVAKATDKLTAIDCTGGQLHYLAQGVLLGGTKEYEPYFTGGTLAAPNMAMADEWTRCLNQTDINIQRTENGVVVPGAPGVQNITTYTIDVYNPTASGKNGAEKNHSSLLASMAKQGGGQYFSAKNQQVIIDKLTSIVATIKSVNSTFAAASLPVNAANRTQNANQVFIGMFRPDGARNPRWFGNLKQYAIGRVNGQLDLVDKLNNPATNPLTGFINNCAVSFWTEPSEYTDASATTHGYWEESYVRGNPLDGAMGINPSPSQDFCEDPTISPRYKFSDYPDGQKVEKGAVAGVLRRGNNAPATTATPTWSAAARTVISRSGNNFEAFDTAARRTTLGDSLVDFMLGKDVNNEQQDPQFEAATVANTLRPSIHGDVVHSRPLPVNYGSSIGVIAYYGANDGTFRSVYTKIGTDGTADPQAGKELWAFIPPEFSKSRLNRLLLNPDGDLETNRKDYFFDGSTGIVQNEDNTKTWIYPTQRRGGRMLYGINVSKSTIATPTDGSVTQTPVLKWRQGCETHLTTAGNDTTCTDPSFNGIGQTWSTPAAAYIKGYPTGPVIIVGGGYDTCEDADALPSALSTSVCNNPKGAKVYILDADTGVLLKSFDTLRSVAADVSLIDVDNDNLVDYAYVADTGGNIYRINFIDGPSAKAALNNDLWTIHRIAYTNGGGRKFLFNPGLLPYKGTHVYIGIVSGDRERPLEGNYPYRTPVTNRAYVYLDKLDPYDAPLDAAITDIELCDLDSDNCTWDRTTDAGCGTTKLLPGVDKAGWRMDLQNGRGEQGVTATLIVGGLVEFSTNRPVPAAAGSCNSILGKAYGYRLNLLNASGDIGVAGTCGGARSAEFAGGGLPPSPVLGVVPVDGVSTVVVLGAVPKDGGAASPVKPEEPKLAVPPVRNRKYMYQKIDK